VPESTSLLNKNASRCRLPGWCSKLKV